MHFFTILGGMLETFLIIIVGYTLVGIVIKDKIIPLLVVSFYGSVILTMVKENVSVFIYLFALILSIGVLLTFVVNVNIKISLIGLVSGAILLLLSEFSSFLILYQIQLLLNIDIMGMPLILLAIPHMLIMLSLYVIFNKYRLQIYCLKNGCKNSNYKFYSTLFVLFGLLFLYYSVIYKSSSYEFFNNITFAVFLVLVTLVAFSVIRHQLKVKLEDLSLMLNDQYEEDLSTYISTIKLQRHDFIHHLLATKKMLDSGSFDECKKYLEDVLDETSGVSEILPLSSDAVGGMLLSYKEMAIKKNINIHYNIYDNLSDIPCRVYELNKILGNLILNSIEAVEFLEGCKKHVNVNIGKTATDYYFEISNPTNVLEFEKNLTEIFTQGFSTKGKVNNQGQGLTIVHSIVEKYKGYIYPELLDDTVIFIVKIPYGGRNAKFIT
ncbi:GHKL domain-containing protein (plasmid) [Bacillus sp. F19]|nr:GHKL domain-containing protein [Bacillus sp. F19]